MTSYAKNVKGSNNQKFQHFISESPWDEDPVIEQIQADVTELIGDKINGSIHIDESGFKKDGKNSVGVKRQYMGRLGKIENCQMGDKLPGLGQMSCSRYWIERAIEDAKGEAGLADYQVRGWIEWHHHMVMRQSQGNTKLFNHNVYHRKYQFSTLFRKGFIRCFNPFIGFNHFDLRNMTPHCFFNPFCTH